MTTSILTRSNAPILTRAREALEAYEDPQTVASMGDHAALQAFERFTLARAATVQRIQPRIRGCDQAREPSAESSWDAWV